MTYADSAPRALGMSRNEAAPAVPVAPPHLESPPPGAESFIPPRRFTHELTIRVYDVCAEHGRHTDPELRALGHYAPED